MNCMYHITDAPLLVSVASACFLGPLCKYGARGFAKGAPSAHRIAKNKCGDESCKMELIDWQLQNNQPAKKLFLVRPSLARRFLFEVYIVDVAPLVCAMKCGYM